MELLLGVFLPAWGSALLFNIGSSTGGTDIIAMIVKKYFKCHIGRALLIVDFFITLMTFVAFGPETGLFSMVGLFIRSFAVDLFLENMNTYKYFTIITDKRRRFTATSPTCCTAARPFTRRRAFTSTPKRRSS